MVSKQRDGSAEDVGPGTRRGDTHLATVTGSNASRLSRRRAPDQPANSSDTVDSSDPAIVSRIGHRSRQRLARKLDPQTWWHELGPQFWRQREAFELNPIDRVQVASAAAFDYLLRTGASSLMNSTALPLWLYPPTTFEMLESEALYAELGARHDPAAFFRSPPEPVSARRDPAWSPVFRPGDGICEDLTFVSRYQPINPRISHTYARHRQNLMAHLRYWHHQDGPRPTVIAIHGFMADAFWLNEWLFELRWFYEQLGCDVALFTLPFHGNRQTRYSLYSGHGFFAGGLARINEAFGQAVMDFRGFLDVLHEQFGVTRVGVTGISLGGYTSALLAAVEPRLQFAIPNVPVASLGDLMMEWEPTGTLLRGMLGLVGKDVTDLRRMTAVTSPLNYRPVLPRERLMVVGGVGDRLASPYQQKLIWEHWDRCRLYWFPGSHVLHLDKVGFLDAIERFLTEIDFLE